jgi:hypothetical protein
MNFAQKTARFILALPITLILLPAHLVDYYSDKSFISNTELIRSMRGRSFSISLPLLFCWLVSPLLIPFFPLFVVWNTITGEQCQVSRWVFGVPND